MIVAGLDIGNQTGKAVLLGDRAEVLASAVVDDAEEAAVVADRALSAALAKIGLSRDRLDRIVVTGVGRNAVGFAHHAITEVSCDAKGAISLFSSTRTIIDIGAEDARGLRCDGHGKVSDFVMNDKCASGAGVFIEAMAKALEFDLDQMAERSLQSQNEIEVNCTCAVFAESEVVSLIHRKVPRADIARGIHDSIALRSVSMLRRIGIHDDLVLVGGVARNAAMVEAIARRSGKHVLVPENPVIVGALGAALYALEEVGA